MFKRFSFPNFFKTILVPFFYCSFPNFFFSNGFFPLKKIVFPAISSYFPFSNGSFSILSTQWSTRHAHRVHQHSHQGAGRPICLGARRNQRALRVRVRVTSRGTFSERGSCVPHQQDGVWARDGGCWRQCIQVEENIIILSRSILI